jgi:hypothetical protein
MNVDEQKLIDEQKSPNLNDIVEMPKPNPNPTNQMIKIESGPGRYIYSVFHTMMSLVAIYLSFRCNKGFKVGSFFLALFFPYIYIIYILATRGTCGILEGDQFLPILSK